MEKTTMSTHPNQPCQEGSGNKNITTFKLNKETKFSLERKGNGKIEQMLTTVGAGAAYRAIDAGSLRDATAYKSELKPAPSFLFLIFLPPLF